MVHTKTKWIVVPVNTQRMKIAYKIIDSENILIGSDEALGNARLIASAPGLLRVCKEAVKALEKYQKNGWVSDLLAFDKLKQIIKQAEKQGNKQ